MIRRVIGTLALALFFGAIPQLRADFIITSPPAYAGEEFSFETSGPSFVHYFGDNYNSSGSGSSAFDSGTGYHATGADSASLSYAIGPTSFSAIAHATATTSVTNTDTSGLEFQVSASASMYYFAFSTDRPTLATVTFDPTMTITSSDLQFPGNSGGSASVNASISIDGSDGSNLSVYGTYSEQFPAQTTFGYVYASSTSGAPSYTYTQVNGDSISLALAPGTYSLYFNAQSKIDIAGDPPTGSITASASAITSELSFSAVPEPSACLLLSLGAVSLYGSRSISRRYKRA
jgi:hypothetical protein